MAIFKKIKNILLGKNTLYYPGCLTKFTLPQISKNYQTILTNLGIEFITLKDDEFCCGSPVLNAGYPEDFQNLRLKNNETFKKYNIGRIITNCPSCYYMFKKYYPNLEVIHMIEIVHSKIKKLSQKFDNDTITYHDPCHLGRKSGLYEEPREILEKLGFDIIEFNETKDSSLCCGGGAGLVNNFSEISNKIARLRLSQCKAKKLITPCPMCYRHLKNNSSDIEILEFSEVLV